MNRIIATAFCALMPLPDFEECVRLIPPPIEELPWSVTNYWPFQGDILMAWNGQADSDPLHFASMLEVDTSLEWQVGAAPLSLMGRTFIFPDGRELRIVDTFGNLQYQAGPIWHDHYKMWVLPIDVFTPEPLHYLEWDGYIK